jgi:hypothetical protein
MRLIELEVGAFFRRPSWSENAIGELVGEPVAIHGLATIQVHVCPSGATPRASTRRSRLATDNEMAYEGWLVVDRPPWLRTGGSGDS